LRGHPNSGTSAPPNLKMKTQTKAAPENQVLELLKQVLPKATHDPLLAGRIYQAVEKELQAQARTAAFEKFCARVALPNLEPPSVAEVKTQLAASFGDGDVTVKPNRKEQSLSVEVSLADGGQLACDIQVNTRAASAAEEGEPEVMLKFAPFPVCLSGDPELVWLLAKRENLSPDEAGMALATAEEEFWLSKTGQKLLREGTERSFPEFIARVPAGVLSEAGLRRHYKEPEAIKALRAAAKPVRRTGRPSA
jgi:hypothetical protein